MNFKTGDKVVVIAGKDKGKEGKITKVLRNENKIVIEGVNVVKKHNKGNGQTAGSIVEMEAPINASNAMMFIEEVIEETKKFYGLIPEGTEFKGITSEAETFIQNCQKYHYLFGLCEVQ